MTTKAKPTPSLGAQALAVLSNGRTSLATAAAKARAAIAAADRALRSGRLREDEHAEVVTRLRSDLDAAMRESRAVLGRAAETVAHARHEFREAGRLPRSTSSAVGDALLAREIRERFLRKPPEDRFAEAESFARAGDRRVVSALVDDPLREIVSEREADELLQRTAVVAEPGRFAVFRDLLTASDLLAEDALESGHGVATELNRLELLDHVGGDYGRVAHAFLEAPGRVGPDAAAASSAAAGGEGGSPNPGSAAA